MSSLRQGLTEHVVLTTTTPFTADSRYVDWDRIGMNTSALLAEGIRTFVPCGNTGECYSLTLDEQLEVIRTTVAAVGEPGWVLAGVGGYGAATVIDQCHRALEAGADGVMVMTPIQTYTHPDGVERFFERILDEVRGELVIYKRGPVITDDVLARLVQHERVVGVKYAVNDLNAFASVVDRAGPDVTAWVCGTAERWAPFFATGGAVSFTTGIGNFVPSLSVAMLKALKQGDMGEAMRLRAQALPLEQLRARHSDANNVPVVKAGMDLLDLYGGPVRAPLRDLSDEDTTELREHLQTMNVPVQ